LQSLSCRWPAPKHSEQPARPARRCAGAGRGPTKTATQPDEPIFDGTPNDFGFCHRRLFVGEQVLERAAHMMFGHVLNAFRIINQFASGQQFDLGTIDARAFTPLRVLVPEP